MFLRGDQLHVSLGWSRQFAGWKRLPGGVSNFLETKDDHLPHWSVRCFGRLVLVIAHISEFALVLDRGPLLLANEQMELSAISFVVVDGLVASLHLLVPGLPFAAVVEEPVLFVP